VRRSSPADLPDLPVRNVKVPELLAELSEVQETIRVSDPSASATDADTRNPTLLALFRQERLILHELKRRQTLLRQGIRWTTLVNHGGSVPASAFAPGERQGPSH
jgi:hypothetical protein